MQVFLNQSNPIALRKATTEYNFGLSECNTVNLSIRSTTKAGMRTVRKAMLRKYDIFVLTGWIASTLTQRRFLLCELIYSVTEFCETNRKNKTKKHILRYTMTL